MTVLYFASSVENLVFQLCRFKVKMKGNEKEHRNYEWWRNRVYYKLKQMDNCGKDTYLSIITSII